MVDKIKQIPQWKKSILLLDVSKIYSRIEVNHFKRKQTIGLLNMFPQEIQGICACGCGAELTGKQKRWASEECQNFAVAVHQIIGGDPMFIDRYLELWQGGRYCNNCKRTDKDCPKEKLRDNWQFLQKDHIIPVHKGGGGCWLDNYQFLCDDCHKEKSKIDRK